MRILLENKQNTNLVLLITFQGLFFSSLAYSQADSTDNSTASREQRVNSLVTADASPGQNRVFET